MSSAILTPDASQWRSLLFLPQFAFAKVGQLDADCFLVDLQDAVPLQAKAGARRGLVEACRAGVFAGRNVVVRINELALPRELAADLDACVGLPDLLGFMPTMIERPEELDRVHELVAERERAVGVPVGALRLLPLIETPGAVLNAYAMARAGGGRNLGLFLGTGDLLRLSAATAVSEMTLDFPRNTVVYAARAAGIEPFDTPHTAVADRIGLERDSRAAKLHGFTGKACVHASQLDVVNRELMPSAAEIAWSRAIIDAQRSGELGTLVARAPELQDDEEATPRSTDGMAIVDGRLIGPPHVKTAKRVMARASRLERALEPAGIIGRVVSHRLEARDAPGAELPNPYELTMSAGWRELWTQCFYSHDRAVTSAPFAERLGLGAVRVDEERAVFALDKLELYRRQPEDVAPTPALAEEESSDARAAGVFRDALLRRAAGAQLEGLRLAPDPRLVTPLTTGSAARRGRRGSRARSSRKSRGGWFARCRCVERLAVEQASAAPRGHRHGRRPAKTR